MDGNDSATPRGKDWSLRGSIRVSLVSALSLVAAFLLLYHFIVLSYARSQVREARASLAARALSSMNTLLSTMDTSAKRAVYSASVQAVAFTTSPIEYLSNRSAAMDFLRNAMFASGVISDFYIQRQGAAGFSYQGGWYARNRYKTLIQDNETLREGHFSPFFLTNTYISEPPRSVETNELLYCLPVFNVRFSGKQEQQEAVALVSLNTSAFEEGVAGGSNPDEIIALYFGDRLVSVSTQDPALREAAARLFWQEPGKVSAIHAGGESYMQSRLTLDSTGWSIGYIVPERTLIAPILHVRNLSAGVLIAAMGIIALTLEYILRRALRHVRELTDAVARVDAEQRRAPINTRMTELAPVADRLNQAIDALYAAREKDRRMSESLYQAMLAQNQAALSAYRNQITPHFLFNTMETMRAMARSVQAKELEGLIRSASLFLRHTLRSDQVVELREELRYIRVYCDILNARFPDRYELRFRVSESAMGRSILSTVLQPLVENSISYGYSVERGPLTMLLSADTFGDSAGEPGLRLTFADNGRGMSESALESLRKQVYDARMEAPPSHIGLMNIYHRMRLCFGDRFSMSLRSREGRYMRVTMMIPQLDGAMRRLRSGAGDYPPAP
ncbi:MAG: histidine kinase [Oscillospiraceae bacterium]|jgi:two-component system sensor histidine kinase YesM|nr:histidine kinase [Oscillospiraceae bacterium]